MASSSFSSASHTEFSLHCMNASCFANKSSFHTSLNFMNQHHSSGNCYSIPFKTVECVLLRIEKQDFPSHNQVKVLLIPEHSKKRNAIACRSNSEFPDFDSTDEFPSCSSSNSIPHSTNTHSNFRLASSSYIATSNLSSFHSEDPLPSPFSNTEGEENGHSNRSDYLKHFPRPIKNQNINSTELLPTISNQNHSTFSSNASISNSNSDSEFVKATQAKKESSKPSLLPSELNPRFLPSHIAIIMDGNSRWAKRRNLLTEFGHREGIRPLQMVVRLSSEWGIKALTVFAFSTENWDRPKREVQMLMSVFEEAIKNQIPGLHGQNVCVRFIGDLSRLSEPIQRLIQNAHELTRENLGLRLNIAVSYSGRADILSACQKIAHKISDGELSTNDITEDIFERELQSSFDGSEAFGFPELLIRTSGEKRLSNFMLWQLAYSELVFCEPLWPDFTETDFKQALVEFQNRNRRFGKR